MCFRFRYVLEMMTWAQSPKLVVPEGALAPTVGEFPAQRGGSRSG